MPPSLKKHNSLKRLLRPEVLKRLLAEAQEAVGATTAIAVCERDTVLPGAHASFVDAGGKEGDLTFPLHADGHPCGVLILRPAGHGKAEGVGIDAARFGRMLATALQEIIDREEARRAVAEETLEQYRESALLHKTTILFNQSLRLDDVSQALLRQCQNTEIHAEMGMVFGTGQADREWRMLSSFGPADECGLAAITASRLFREIVAGGKGEIINDLPSDIRWQDEVPQLQALICNPLKSPGHWAGGLILATRRPGQVFQAAHLKQVSTLGQVAATAMANAHHFEEVQGMLDALLQALTTAIDARDPCTSGHSHRVAKYAVALARLIGSDEDGALDIRFSEQEIKEIHYAAMLHDVGKIGVAEAVLTKSSRLPPERLEALCHRLAQWGAQANRDWQAMYVQLQAINKANVITDQDIALIEELANQKIGLGEVVFPVVHDDERQQLLIPRGNLNAAEWLEIKNHPAESYRILQHIPFPRDLERVRAIILQHHEKIDGSGYPNGVHGKEILPQSRILAIVDIYDALTAADRPYKRALSREKALSILQQEAAAGKIDAALTAFFSQNLQSIEEQGAAMGQIPSAR